MLPRQAGKAKENSCWAHLLTADEDKSPQTFLLNHLQANVAKGRLFHLCIIRGSSGSDNTHWDARLGAQMQCVSARLWFIDEFKPDLWDLTRMSVSSSAFKVNLAAELEERSWTGEEPMVQRGDKSDFSGPPTANYANEENVGSCLSVKRVFRSSNLYIQMYKNTLFPNTFLYQLQWNIWCI